MLDSFVPFRFGLSRRTPVSSTSISTSSEAPSSSSSAAPSSSSSEAPSSASTSRSSSSSSSSSSPSPSASSSPSTIPARIMILLKLLLVTVLMTSHPVTAQDPFVQFTIKEEMDPGSSVGSLGDDRVLPLDLDSQVRKSLLYSSLPKGFPRSNLFSVDKDTGMISVRERIDRDSLCGVEALCDLDIQVAVHSGLSQLFKKVKVTIRVEDINDNPPEFPRTSIQLDIPENVQTGTAYPLEAANDLDIGSNGVKEYELFPKDTPFSVNVTKSPDDGRSVINLIVRSELDRETRATHSLLLTAIDGGDKPLTGTTSILVKLDDVNDNAPVFDKESYNVSLPETSPVGTKVISVSASDDDTHVFGVKEYRLKPLPRQDSQRVFAINASTGDITVAGSLLKRQGQTFRLVVECIDKGLPPMVSRKEVVITVEDTTNSAPQITLNVMFGGTVSEAAQSGTVVALLGVEDNDAGLNGIIRCSIFSDAFQLQARSVNEFKVIVVRRLDRETEPVHNVSVKCEDAGKPPLSDSDNFLVKVKDENDKDPNFTQAIYQKSVPENNRRGQILLRVDARDEDIGENGRLSFSLKDADASLRVDARGNIIATEPLDFETTPEMRFRVIATDNGITLKRSATAEVIINLTDLNDEVPIFEKTEYRFDIFENKDPNTTVGTVKATDKDSGENGRISYAIYPEISPFRISHTGVITTKEKLDREFKASYALTIMARDHGAQTNTGNVTVTVKVADQNDHKPRIMYPRSGNSTVALAFATKPGSIVLTVLAEDRDIGANRKLEYHLASSSGRAMFDMKRESGELVLRRQLTPQDAGRHRLTVVVTDKSGSLPLASNSTFDVLVFAPNSTMTPEVDKEKEHVMVVIILGVVTGIVTVAVIITIVVIRRADSQRRKYVQSRTKLPAEVEKFEGSRVSSPGYVISNSVPDGSKTKGGGGGGGSSGGDSSKDITQDEGFADKSFNTSHGSAGTSGDQSEWSKALRLHQDLLKLHGVDPTFLVQGANVDDVTSDGSVESTTCDSGRGGSEEDTHSHGRASPTVHKEASSLNNLNMPPPRPIRHKSGTKLMSSFGPQTTMPHLSHNLHNNSRPGGRLPNLTGRQLGHSLDAANLPVPLQPARSTSVPPQPPVKHVSFRDDFRHEWAELLPPHPRGQGPNSNSSHWRPHIGGLPSSNNSSVHPKNGGYGQLELAIDHSFETGDDGNSTTTSGSYTVDDLSPRNINTPYLPEQAIV